MMMLAKNKDLKEIIVQLSWNHPESLFYTIEVTMSRCLMIERKSNGNVILQLEISLLKVYSIPYR